ncbi:MAG TPA: hypothetical protein VK929_04880 [Longimicrobiales bacterium]|nr:hypothetical protein [Longimicrobiales bacterium]
MDLAITILAVAGAAAVVVRGVASLFRALRGGVDAFLARDLADVRAQRGDLTGVSDAASVRAEARRRRMVALGAAGFWIGLLIVPPLTPWPRFLYVVYSLLWLVPRRPTTPHHV